jgi:putative heme transporter
MPMVWFDTARQRVQNRMADARRGWTPPPFRAGPEFGLTPAPVAVAVAVAVVERTPSVDDGLPRGIRVAGAWAWRIILFHSGRLRADPGDRPAACGGHPDRGRAAAGRPVPADRRRPAPARHERLGRCRARADHRPDRGLRRPHADHPDLHLATGRPERSGRRRHPGGADLARPRAAAPVADPATASNAYRRRSPTIRGRSLPVPRTPPPPLAKSWRFLPRPVHALLLPARRRPDLDLRVPDAPRNARIPAARAGHYSWHTLVSYVRATVLVAFVDAVGIGMGLAVLRVPLALPLAALVFLGGFIPVIGATLTGAVPCSSRWSPSARSRP